MGLKLCFFALFLCICLLLTTLDARPHGQPDHALDNMRQIPQWHCLRYRRFDLVRRCRNHRLLNTRLLREHLSSVTQERKLGSKEGSENKKDENIHDFILGNEEQLRLHKL